MLSKLFKKFNFSEPSTWAGISVILGVFGLKIPADAIPIFQGLIPHIVAAITAITALIAIFKKEGSNK